eukprot:Pgem_evm1s14001
MCHNLCICSVLVEFSFNGVGKKSVKSGKSDKSSHGCKIYFVKLFIRQGKFPQFIYTDIIE